MTINRREFIAATSLGAVALSAGQIIPGLAEASATWNRVRPGDPGWPDASMWRSLSDAVGGRLIEVRSPFERCAGSGDAQACEDAMSIFTNPFHVQDEPGATQTLGWHGGWKSAASVYAVEAEGPEDVAAAVNFARDHRLRLVIKGGAHSYLGQSSSADSLMIWTRRMDRIEVHDAFVPKGCESTHAPVPAVSVGSGAKFIQLYDAVVTKANRYVQGGGCTSVGVGGHTQTGGFGSFSRYGGMTAAALLEAEIVTADGEVRIVNACTDPDLFFALKGGGAGFGVTTRLTLATHPLPEQFGFYGRTITAAIDADFRLLTERVLTIVRDNTLNPHWGEQIAFGPDNTVRIEMVFQGLSQDGVRQTWSDLDAFLADNPDRFKSGEPRIVTAPARHWWDLDYRRANLPNSIVEDPRPGAPDRFWWSGNASEVGIYFSGYDSMWLSHDLLDPERMGATVDGIVQASRNFPISLHLNKGLHGATEERVAEARETAIHPSALTAFALVIVAGGQQRVHPDVPGHQPDADTLAAEGARIAAALSALRAVAGETGAYSSEMSFFESAWQERAWGPNYPRLLAVKQAYDPEGLFTGHHQVGSEAWSDDGFSRRV